MISVRNRLGGIVTMAVVMAAVLAYALIPSTRYHAATETFTVDNLVAQTSIKDQGLTASTIVTNNGSNVLQSYAGSGCGSGSAIQALSGSGSPTCVAVGAGGGSSSGLFNGTMSSPIPSTTALGLADWSTATPGTWRNRAQGLEWDFTPGGSMSGPAYKVQTASVPATPYTATATILLNYGAGNSGNVGIGWTNGTNGSTANAQVLIYCGSCSSGFQQRIFDYTTSGSVAQLVNQSAALVRTSTPSGAAYGLPVFLQLSDDGTTVSFKISFDGIEYVTVYSNLKSTAFLGSSGYSHFMVGVNDMSSSGFYALTSWTVTQP